MALRFRLGPIPVTVHALFFLTALLLGSTGSEPSAVRVALWTCVMLVSVLVHELGHALISRVFGMQPQIVLHGMGGTTSWRSDPERPLSHQKAMLISVAGPAFGLLLGALIWLIARQWPAASDSPVWRDFFSIALYINIGWSLFNLLPLLPLDGGQIMAHGLGWLLNDRAPRLPHYLSIGAAVLLALAALYIQWLWVVLLSLMFALQNVQALRALRALREEGPHFEQLAEGQRALAEGDGQQAIAVAEQLLQRTRLLEIQHGALRLLAHGRLMEGQWAALMDLLDKARAQLGPSELQRFEQAARELDRPDEAAQIRAWLSELSAPRGASSLPFRA